MRDEMEEYGFTKFICPFGVKIIGTHDYPDSYMLFSANIVS